MYILRPDEKTTSVMLYTQDTLVRGDVVTTPNVHRVNIWLRTDGAPKYMHILKPQVIVFGGGTVKPLSYSELYFPTSQIIAFHTLPPTDEPLDFDFEETDRMMHTLDLLVGTFVMRSKQYIAALRRKLEEQSPQKRLVTSDEVAALILYLCGEEARGITGQGLNIDGGTVM